MFRIVPFLLRHTSIAENFRSPKSGLLGWLSVQIMNAANRATSVDAAQRLNITSSDVVLELGPGSGWGMREIAKRNPRRLIGIEVSERFRKELSELPFNKEIYNSDCIDCSSFLSAKSVDKLLAINVVYFLSPLPNYAIEIYRVMKPNSHGIIGCKPRSITEGNHNIFVNKSTCYIKSCFEDAGFKVYQEKIDIGNPMNNYVALHIRK